MTIFHEEARRLIESALGERVLGDSEAMAVRKVLVKALWHLDRAEHMQCDSSECEGEERLAQREDEDNAGVPDHRALWECMTCWRTIQCVDCGAAWTSDHECVPVPPRKATDEETLDAMARLFSAEEWPGASGLEDLAAMVRDSGRRIVNNPSVEWHRH